MRYLTLLLIASLGGMFLPTVCRGEVLDVVHPVVRMPWYPRMQAAKAHAIKVEREQMEKENALFFRRAAIADPIAAARAMKVPDKRSEDDRHADHLLTLALMLNAQGRFQQQVIERLQYIIKEYPDTTAAKKAEKRLSHMKP